MKKLLVLFVLLDLAFIGLVLKLRPTAPSRTVATAPDNGLTEGQNQKLHLLQSFLFSKSDQKISLKTDYLQSICGGYSMISLKFKATDVAVSGQPPQIIHTHSCAEIQQNPAQDTLETEVEQFRLLHRRNDIRGMAAFAVYPDEDFPAQWKLFEILVTGEENFTINEAELEQFSSQTYIFEL